MPIKELQVFLTVNNKDLTGKLTLDGKDTLLTVHSKEPVVKLPEYMECVCQDGQKASLLDCLSFGGGHSSHYNEVIYNAQAFPHIVILGATYCTAVESTVKSFCFHLSDAEQLFFDIEPWVQEDGFELNDEKNTYKHIFGFTGPGVIFEADSEIGKISAYHSPSFQGPSMSGFSAKNKVIVSIEPKKPISVEELIVLLYRFKHFTEVCSGHPQGIEEISFVSTKKIDENHFARLELIISHGEDGSSSDRYTNGFDMLAAPCLDRGGFENLVAQWFCEADQRRRVALSRFSSNIKDETYYDSNRLVSAASLFEWFDSSKKVSVPECISSLVSKTMTDLSSFPDSEIRTRLLGMLGNVGSETLLHKMQRQLNGVLDVLDSYEGFDRKKAELVITYAVKCRNELVHGARKKKVTRLLGLHQPFLTETLEVLFACLCLHASGWGIHRRDDRHLRGGSRYGGFIRHFNARAEELISDASGKI